MTFSSFFITKKELVYDGDLRGKHSEALSFINKGQTGPMCLMLSPTFPDQERKLA